MKWRPWKRESTHMDEVEDAARRVRELEARAEHVARRVREDPWASRIMDSIHHLGKPHAG